MGKLFRRIHHLLNRNKLERELNDEMSAHRELYAARGFTRERRFTLSSIAAIALAVGAATAVFSVVDRSLFRALPYNRGDRLVSVGMIMPHLGPGEIIFSGAYRDWRVSQSSLDLTSWSGVTECDLSGDSPQRLSCARTEATFLPTLDAWWRRCELLSGRSIRQSQSELKPWRLGSITFSPGRAFRQRCYRCSLSPGSFWQGSDSTA